MDGKIEENTRKVRNAPSGYGKNIFVAAGHWSDSVEMFNWRQRTWLPLQSIPKERYGATSFVDNNQIVIAGGYCDYYVDDDMIRMNVDPHPDPSIHWSEFHMKLTAMLAHHSSVLYNDKLMVAGCCDGNAISDKIHEVQVVPPYTLKTLSRMPEPRQHHCTEIFDDSLLILGGTTHNYLSSVVLYDIKNNVCKQLAPLPYKVSEMATVRWGDNVVVIGGADQRGNRLNTVIMYNVKTQQREACAAVVVGNNIVVLGGYSGNKTLASVEAFSFERYTWQELPEMSEA